MTLRIQNSFFDDLIRGRINIGADTVKALLLTDAYVYSAAHTRRSNVTAFEVAATGGYTTGGQTITVTSTIDAPNTIYQFGMASFGTGGIRARYVAYYKARGGAASADEILAVLDMSRWFQPEGVIGVPAQILSLRSVA